MVATSSKRSRAPAIESWLWRPHQNRSPPHLGASSNQRWASRASLCLGRWSAGPGHSPVPEVPSPICGEASSTDIIPPLKYSEVLEALSGKQQVEEAGFTGMSSFARHLLYSCWPCYPAKLASHPGILRCILSNYAYLGTRYSKVLTTCGLVLYNLQCFSDSDNLFFMFHNFRIDNDAVSNDNSRDLTFHGAVRTFGLIIHTNTTHALMLDLDHNDTSE